MALAVLHWRGACDVENRYGRTDLVRGQRAANTPPSALPAHSFAARYFAAHYFAALTDVIQPRTR